MFAISHISRVSYFFIIIFYEFGNICIKKKAYFTYIYIPVY